MKFNSIKSDIANQIKCIENFSLYVLPQVKDMLLLLACNTNRAWNKSVTGGYTLTLTTLVGPDENKL